MQKSEEERMRNAERMEGNDKYEQMREAQRGAKSKIRRYKENR